MAEHRFKFPSTEEEIRKLRAGDLVTVDGHIIGIRRSRSSTTVRSRRST